MLNSTVCQKARLSRDPRFDGQFFTAVHTTGIYCRPICPARPPLESNVSYFRLAVEAATAGYRPCLRCRPDSAPDSPAWKGVNTTIERAIKLINGGALQEASLTSLADRLGISDRYLRQLFQTHLGVSPKAYALYQQCLFAKQLLHQTRLPVTQVALASGFNSIRRFNDCFQKQLQLTPSAVRKAHSSDLTESTLTVQLSLCYRPPYDWQHMQSFLKHRVIQRLEWCTENNYGRTFMWQGCTGHFTATHIASEHKFLVNIELDDITKLKSIVHNIRRVLDLDVDIASVQQDLQQHFGTIIAIKQGLRLPGTWSVFEAGIRAILGQQISVVAARNLVTTLVAELGQTTPAGQLFPSSKAIADSDLHFFKMPASRKQTLRNLAQHYVENASENDPQQWLALKGIGAWTVDYAKMRGLSDPDIYLAGDLGVKKAVKDSSQTLQPELAAPWRSYLTLQLWSQL